MGATGISEFTFGYAFLFEQTQRNWADLKAAPILPSLQQEADIGWDAHLPTQATDFYYQFKLSDYLWRSNAKYVSDGTYPNAYYRFGLHRRDNNRQHMLLRRHCVAHPDTYYVAPEFSGLTEFNDSFLAKQITENSRLIKLSDCFDISDGDQHYITYQPGNTGSAQHSQARPIKSTRSGKQIEEIYRNSSKTWRSVDTNFAEALFGSAVSEVLQQPTKGQVVDRSALRLLDLPQQQRTRSGYLRRTAEILSIFCGVTLVLVGKPNQDGVKTKG